MEPLRSSRRVFRGCLVKPRLARQAPRENQDKNLWFCLEEKRKEAIQSEQRLQRRGSCARGKGNLEFYIPKKEDFHLFFKRCFI